MPKFCYPIPRATEITPKAAFLNRRAVIAGLGAGVAFGLSGLPMTARADVMADVAPGPYSTDEALTTKEVATGYCNFFEFGPAKDDPAQHAHRLQTDPWSVDIGGLADTPGPMDMDDLLRRFPLQERIYRLRCVEAWSMVIPWIGFPLADLLAHVGVQSGARYVQFDSFDDMSVMPQQARTLLDWPYTEALRLDEAMHPLTFLAVGMYGERMPNQNGAPIRLVVPWKYGFKSIKSIKRISLLADQPVPTWHAKSPREYGFYANVNPSVRHPRWHQATERRLHDGTRIRTEMFNGYGDLVADLYAGMDLEQNY
ncbi:MAG: protein-methionine-sulfoxide reductase catalytic subunit MsrP [Rhodobacteraceae bacterium]|nr:protein-methionine-sulfoxide reductase catalytic subunit MsrP [Paracoccaceae bacterium]